MLAGWLAGPPAVGELLLAVILKCSQSRQCEDDCLRCTLSRDTSKVDQKSSMGNSWHWLSAGRLTWKKARKIEFHRL